MEKSLIILIFLLSTVASAYSDEVSGVVPIKISSAFKGDYQNQPFVSVTLCEPGTKNCQTIDNILLDTGSVGLRLFSSLVHLNLKTELAPDGGEVTECLTFGGGAVSDWGPVKTVDVVMGGEKAAAIPVELINTSFGNMPSSCVRPESVPTQGNGTLGVLDGVTDCLGEPNCVGGQQYYSCTGNTCTELPTTPASLQVPNPIMDFTRDNNGISITMPKVNEGGEKEVTGKMTLGIGTTSRNKPPSLNDSALKKLAIGQFGEFQVKINGIQYPGIIDSGADSWSFPAALNLPSCTGDLNPYICTSSPLNVSVDILDGSGASIDTVATQVEDGQTLFSSGKAALSELGQNGPFVNTGMFLAGMPFFYGRTIYVGYTGKSTPIGSGPFLAYKNNE